MDCFLEVTEKFEKIKVCVPLKNIKSVSSEKDGTCFIETGTDSEGNSTGIYCDELYSQIVIKLLKFIL